MKIKLIEIAGMVAVLEALRLPYKGVGDSKTSISRDSGEVINTYSSIDIGNKDWELLNKLKYAGDDHAKVLRGLVAYLDITAPRYWWVEMDTYRIGTERLSSESTMNDQAKGLSGKELQKVKSELREGTEQRRIQMFSYQTLARIYRQRKSHRLPEWQEFCDFLWSLPWNDLIIS